MNRKKLITVAALAVLALAFCRRAGDDARATSGGPDVGGLHPSAAPDVVYRHERAAPRSGLPMFSRSDMRFGALWIGRQTSPR